MNVKPDGFELTFTEPVDPATASRVDAYTLETYTYVYRAEYGSPEVDQTKPVIESVKVSPDGRRVRLVTALIPGQVHELKLPGVRNAAGHPLLHSVGYYWLNVVPKS